MRTYYDIQLTDRTIARRELEGEAIGVREAQDLVP